MQFNQTDISTFFDNSEQFYTIPQYQRAYSWEKDQWKQFFNDIKEQAKNENDYFFGNILLERIENERRFEIIDGQQRLTTLVIFMRAMINVSKEAKILSSEDHNSLEEVYIKKNKVIKLKTVSYDNDFFEAVIINNNNENNGFTTPSQERIIGAKEFFLKKLNAESNLLPNILDKIKRTTLNVITLSEKKQAALMFELQNNRGIHLTDLERVKAYFIYQIYINSSKQETNSNIKIISDMFNDIYLHINGIRKITEDEVLRYHCHAYMPRGYGYRAIEEIKTELEERQGDKIEYIKNFVTELRNTFLHLVAFYASDNSNPLKKLLDDKYKMSIPGFIYPFIIKGYKHVGQENLNILFDILEILIFRDGIIHTRATITNRLNDIMKKFDGDLRKLKKDIHIKLNQADYWSDERFDDFLNGWMIESSVLHYILWEYEDHIRSSEDAKTHPAQIMGGKDAKIEIEHIAPQTENENEEIATGYPQYKGKFTDDGYLHCLGNLMLISKVHNTHIGNKPFWEKLQTYKEFRLLKQQMEIEHFADNSTQPPQWSMESIDKRHGAIVDFVKERWDFDKITP